MRKKDKQHAKLVKLRVLTHNTSKGLAPNSRNTCRVRLQVPSG